MKLTDLTATIRAIADIPEKDAQAIAGGLVERGLIKAEVPVKPVACECCGTLFYPDRNTARFCSPKCVPAFDHL